MELNKDTRDRVFSAADALYEQAGRGAFPTVDAVRKASKVNMNDAATAMKQWRRAQTAQAAPVAITVPNAVEQLHHQALVTLWQSAQETANESLRIAQAGWEAERTEAETLNKQLGDAYEVQAAELEAAHRLIEELAAKHQAERQRVAELVQQLDATLIAKLAAENRATIAEQRALEIDRRAVDLRTALDLAHQDVVQVRTEISTVRAKAEAAEQACQEQRKAAGKAREEAANWCGQVAALKEQQLGLLEAVKTGKPPGRAAGEEDVRKD